MIKKYFNSWLKYTEGTTQIAFQSRSGAALFILGKLLRYIFFLYFLILLVSKTTLIAGFNLWQIILFYATYNLVDTFAQFFLREVYRFRFHVVSGYFDHILLKPLSPLFKSLFGGSDLLDLPILLMSIGLIVFSINKIGDVTSSGIILYLILVINSFIISLAFHILVLGFGILSTTVDHTVMIYRDIVQMGRVPIDLYQQPLRGVLTYIIPVGIMVTFPAKALLNLLSLDFIVLSFLFSSIFLFISLKFWNFSLKHYQSASS